MDAPRPLTARTEAGLRALYCTVVLITASCTGAPERNVADSHGVIPSHWTAAESSSAPIMDQWVDSFADPALTALVKCLLTSTAARLSLAVRIAQSYFEWVEANLQAEVAEQSIKDRRTIVDLVRGRFV